MNYHISNDEFLKRLYERHGNEYKLIGEYKHCQQKITLLHKKCNLTTDILPSNAISKRLPIPCKYCNPHSKKDTDIFKYQLEINFPNQYTVIGEYMGANKPIEAKCNNCGKSYLYERASGLLHGMIHCPYCHKGSNTNSNSYAYKVFKKYGDEYSVLGTYINSRTVIEMEHNICGFKYKVNPNEFLRGRELCPLCTDRSKLKNTESVKREMKEKYGNKFELLENYKNTNDFYNFQCKSCYRQITLQMSYVLSNSSQCPYCGDGVSYPEKFMRSVLEQLNISYIPEYSSRNCSWSGNYRYDFYLPDYNWIIETHGLQHYEGGWDLEKTQASDKIKYELAIKNNIDKYIVIDARKSDPVFIKNNIISSDLNIFNLDKIDWKLCNLVANKPYFKDIVELWNKGYEVKDIAKELKLSTPNISRKLTEANKLNALNREYGGYSTARAKAVILRNSKRVKCIETGEEFNSAKEADKFYNPEHIPKGNVGHCASGQQKTAYGLHWIYI